METVEHLEGTMTDSVEGHSSEVNLFSPCIKLETDRDISAFFAIFLTSLTQDQQHETPRAIIGNLIVDPISTEKFSFGPTDNR